LKASIAYDLVASVYDHWHWSALWHRNEAPIVRRWLEDLQPGIGLDAGSGTGPYVTDIVTGGHRCVVVDVSSEMLHLNRLKAGTYVRDGSVEFVEANINALPFDDGQFDWILCTRVLSHLPDLIKPLREFARVLRSGGECLITDVHPNHPYEKVSIPINGKKLRIETYKHSLADFNRSIANVEDFELLKLDEYHFEDLLWRPPWQGFEKLYRHSNPAMFYTCELKKI
jgi:ubiquinone/menaquinone biosynthesis C-methylase UbiE